MKLKEKLAEEFWLKNRELIEKGKGIHSCQEFYQAGFEKAREMTSEFFFRSISPNGRIIYKLVSNLGEEEVE